MAQGSPNYPSISNHDYPSRPDLSTSSSSSHLLSRESSKGSMLLYRLATEGESLDARRAASASDSRPQQDTSLPHAALSARNRRSAASTLSAASVMNPPRGFVPYEYDPILDNGKPDDEEDTLHDPRDVEKAGKRAHNGAHLWSMRGFQNLGVLVLLVLGMLALFLVYPIIVHFQDVVRNQNLASVGGNTVIRGNSTGSVPRLLADDRLIDPDTPIVAKTRTGFDGEDYVLVFSDEFNEAGRTFNPGDDPYFEAVDMWYGVTADLEWYDPSQVTTRDGALVLTMDRAGPSQPNLTPGSTAPFTTAENHNQSYRSGMVQSWNKLCFTSGYIEVSVLLPGRPGWDGFWPGAWTMGNLGRPGYRSTTDALWPYTYDTCDIGTFPNQTAKGDPPKLLPPNPDGTLQWEQYDGKFSALNGQRLSACTCPNSDHPGPWGKFNGESKERYRGRGVPEIDILEVQKDGLGPGNAASQSLQYAPFTEGYGYDKTAMTLFNKSISVANGWPGSPLQQAVSGITSIPVEGHQFSPNKRFVTFGFEYWADPNNRDDGFITWQVDGKPSTKVTAGVGAPDKGPGGSGVSQRLIPEEPMSIILNLGISNGWTNIQFETLDFPAELQFDYIRIYQRKGHENIGCSPKDYPTADYINKHIEQYNNINLTSWQDGTPRNGLYEGSC